MILLRGSVWVRLAYLLGISCGELALWRAQWAVDTANRAHFRTLRVRSGQQLQVEGANDTPDQPIVHYQTPAGHSHRLRIYMKRARLSPESQAAFAEAHQLAPKGDAVLKIAPDPQYEHVHGHECSVNLLIGFSDAGGQSPRDAKRRTVLLYPSQSQAGESSNSDSVRTVHVQSSSELAIRFSTNSVAGKQGPRCRSVLTMQQDEQSWPSPLGMDWEWTFIAAENSDIRVTFSPDMWTGEGEIGFGQELDSLALEPIQPRRLTVLGFEGSHVVVSRERTGQPFLTANTLKLGPDFLDVGLDGKAGIPIRELLASWQWAAGAIVNGSLLGWWLSGVMGRRDRVFLSYSRADESRVMEI
jgi:hypothetical protein